MENRFLNDRDIYSVDMIFTEHNELGLQLSYLCFYSPSCVCVCVFMCRSLGWGRAQSNPDTCLLDFALAVEVGGLLIEQIQSPPPWDVGRALT